MKICIFGAGAIGGFLAVKLAATKAQVSVVARGAHLAAMQSGGLQLIEGGATKTAAISATDDPAQLGPQDYVFLTLKAHSVPAAVPHIMPLIGPDTTIICAVNGVPWWYFYKEGGPHENTRLASVDPGNAQWQGLGPERILGCVIYTAAEVSAPGIVTHNAGNRFLLGEPDGRRTKRAIALSELLTETGLIAPVSETLRTDIWMKLWGNVTFNPMSVLTQATLDVLCTDEGTRAVAQAMMGETQTVAQALGITFSMALEDRIKAVGAVGAHRTSMLQDFDAGRPMEIDALVTSVQELGRLTDTPTPTIDTVLSLLRLRAKTAALAP